jgi:hypothetical protein
VGAKCGGDGVGEGEGGDMVERGACVTLGSDWAFDYRRGGPRDIMDYVGQWLYVVEMVWMCVLAMWPM